MSCDAMRGEFDSDAFVQRYHSAVIHQEYAPTSSPGRELFALCEEARCEVRGMQQFAGVRTNILAHHRDRLEKSDLLNAHLASLIPLGEGLQVVVRDSLVGAGKTLKWIALASACEANGSGRDFLNVWRDCAPFNRIRPHLPRYLWA